MSSATIPTINCKCGRRHQAFWISQAGVQFGCRVAAGIERDEWTASAVGIAALAAQQRAEAESYMLAYRTGVAAGRGDGPRAARHLAQAQEAYAKAYEIEG